MITRFFSTSRPIHLVLITLVVILLFVVARTVGLNNEIDLGYLLFESGVFLVLFASIVVFSFFVSKNTLTLDNGYKLLFFALFLAIVPQTLMNSNTLLANLFIILALRRLFSLKNNLRVKKKLFDAGFWVALATYFYFGAVLFFLLIFVALLVFSISRINNLIVPVLGFLTVLIILTSYSIITTGNYGSFLEIAQLPSYDYSVYNDIGLVIGLTILISFGIWASFFYIKSFKEKLKTAKSVHYLVILNVMIAMILVVTTPKKDGSEFIFLFTPLAIIMSNYLEGVSERWFAEVFIWLLILTPVAKLML
ncbi:MAG: hypothetical protein KJO00_01540 [Bacteroidia bacterium]|nr:hypothetical protein [Bacteroidia bacterium]